jgi:hypothetical protein
MAHHSEAISQLTVQITLLAQSEIISPHFMGPSAFLVKLAPIVTGQGQGN